VLRTVTRRRRAGERSEAIPEVHDSVRPTDQYGECGSTRPRSKADLMVSAVTRAGDLSVSIVRPAGIGGRAPVSEVRSRRRVSRLESLLNRRRSGFSMRPSCTAGETSRATKWTSPPRSVIARRARVGKSAGTVGSGVKVKTKEQRGRLLCWASRGPRISPRD
jgi:hypothetical protein